ncbi:MAG: DUF5704 domain-containing protein [Eubacteriales bacterium]|nr:DUF5704 domain-containing protein [Eubacteriales bacterium]
MKGKNIIILFLWVMMFHIITLSDSFAEIYSREEMQRTLELYSENNYLYREKNIHDFSKEIWQEHGLLVLKNQAKADTIYYESVSERGKKGTKTNKYNDKAKQYKYLGVTVEGYLVENPDYPADAYSGKLFSLFNWTKNKNEKTSLILLLKKMSNEEEAKALYRYYLNIVRESFQREYGDKFDIKPGSKEEENMMKAAILVYPVAEGSRTLISFRNLGGDGVTYEVTASMRRGDAGTSSTKIEEVVETKALIPQASQSQGGSIRIDSEKPGQQSFDIGKGIPAGENVYVQVIGERYLVYLESQIKTHKTIQKTSEKGGPSGIIPKDKVIREVSYTEITKAYVYAIESAEVSSPALPGGKITLTPQNYQVTASMTQGSYQNGSGSNATLTVDGYTITAGDKLPVSGQIGGDVLYQEDIVIPKEAANVKDSIPTGKIRYRLILSYGEDYSPIKEISVSGNPVSLHTPAVCYPRLVAREKKDNESYVWKKNQPFYIKEESFAVVYPTAGQHLNIKGYGNRDYAKYIAKRQIQFSFDVYAGKDYNGNYLKAGEWHDFPADGGEADKDLAHFFIPSWAAEGEEHQIAFRSLPINLKDEQSPAFAYQANLDITKYKAVESFDISIFGRFTDHRILNIGEKEKKANLEMPVYPREGKLARRLDGISLGVPIDFVLTTNHDLFYRDDYLVVNPKYYFVDKQGKKQEVDLYYHGNQSLRKINVANQEIELKTRMKDYTDWVEDSYFEDTARILDGQKRNNSMDYAKYLEAFQSNHRVPLGHHAQITVGERLKVYAGRQLAGRIQKPAGIKPEEIYRSRQNWYFRFFLPNESYVVPKGTDFKKLGGVSLHKEPFLHQGYILVELEFQVYKNGELLHSYQAVPKSVATIPYQAEYGDSFFYDTERRSSHKLN